MEFYTYLPRELIFVALGLFVFNSLLLLIPKDILLQSPIRPYILWLKWTGLTHNWSMFAPKPLSVNRLLSFELEFADGQLKPWRLPQFQLKNGYQQVSQARYFRMHNEILKKRNKQLQGSMCNFVLKAYRQKNPTSPLPVRIHLLRFHQPEDASIRADFPWFSNRIFSFHVKENHLNE